MNTNRAIEVGAGKIDDIDRIFLIEKGTPHGLLCFQKAKLWLQLDQAQWVRMGSDHQMESEIALFPQTLAREEPNILQLSTILQRCMNAYSHHGGWVKLF